MSTKKTTTEILSFLNKKEFKESFNFLEEYSFESFENLLHYAISNINTGCKEEFFTNFFNVYLPNSKYFKELIHSPRRRELFNHLFSFTKLQCPNLYNKLIKEEQEFLIELIKRHQIPFLYKDHLVQISPNEKEKDLLDFCCFATMLSGLEMIHFKEAIDKALKLKDYSIEEVFSLVGCWLNYFNWENIINKGNIDKDGAWNSRAIYAMNAMVDQIIVQRVNKPVVIGRDPLVFQREIINSKDAVPPHFDIFISWLKWQTFVKDVVEQFCFEDSAVIGLTKQGKLTIKISDEMNEKLNYFFKKSNYYESYLDEDYDERKLRGDFEDNVNLLVKGLSPFLSRELRHLKDSYINKIYAKEFNIDSAHLLGFLSMKMLTWKFWYSLKTLTGIKVKKNWKEILIDIDNCDLGSFKGQLPLCEEPDEFTLNEKYADEIKEAGISKELFAQCRDICTMDIDNYKPEKFNRFKPQINLMNFVWFKINHKYYSLLPIVCSVSMHSLIANLALIVNKPNNKNFNNEVMDMETILSDNLKEKGIHAISSQKYEYKIADEKFKGEIDAVLFDGKKILGVEFKRSSFRTTLVEANYEKEVVLEEAARQLDRFKVAIKNKAKFKTPNLGLPDLINLSTYPIEGLIVTTNFEFDHEIIQGRYLKISWIEWLWLSENFESGDDIEALLGKANENVFWETVMKI